MIQDLREGVNCVSEGFSLAKRRSLRPYMIVPLVTNILLFTISGYLVTSYAYEWISGWTTAVDLWSWLDWLEPFIDQLLGALKWIIFAIIILGLLFIMGSTFTMFTHLVIGPFIGILGEKAEFELHTPSYPQHTLGQIALRTLGPGTSQTDLLGGAGRRAGCAFPDSVFYPRGERGGAGDLVPVRFLDTGYAVPGCSGG